MAGVDQTHKQFARIGSTPRAIKQCVFAKVAGVFEPSFTNIIVQRRAHILEDYFAGVGQCDVHLSADVLVTEPGPVGLHQDEA